MFAKSNAVAPVPVTAILVIGTATFVVFVTITHWDGLHSPTSTEPNNRLVAVEPGKRLVADRVIGVVAAMPFPDSAMLCGESIALSVRVTAAERGPGPVGWKCPWMVQLAPTAKLAPQLLRNTNEDGSVPVTTMLDIDKREFPVLVSVTG